MKRILALLLACVLLLTSTAFAAQFSDLQESDAFYDEIQTLVAFGIVSGDTAGTVRPYAALSRAEFAKLAVGLADKLGEAKAATGASRFTDVTSVHWALPYINYVANSGIIVGYPDGTFGPDEEITYAQAITVVLRVLGYDEASVGGVWPDSYLNKAAVLELTEGMQVSAHASISRADAFVLLARALDTETNGTKTKLSAAFGFSLVENAVVLSTYETDASLAVGEVKTSVGTYKCTDMTLLAGRVGAKVQFYLDDEQEIVTVQGYDDYPQTLVIKKHLGGNEYLCMGAEGESVQRFSNGLTVYTEAGKSTYVQMATGFVPGAVLVLHGESAQSPDYAYLSEAEEITPVVAAKDYTDGDIAIADLKLTAPENITVYRDGLSAKLTDIRKYDVIYYNPAIQTMEVYTDKVTGLYSEALPNKANVTQVVVGGRSFTVGKTAVRLLDETAGSLKINDVVTLLLGKDGEVVGAHGAQAQAAATEYGVLLSAGTYITDTVTESGTSKYSVQLMLSDGNVYTYDAKEDYADDKGALVRIRFENGLAVLEDVDGGEFEGAVSQVTHSVGETLLAKDVVLFDLTANPTGGAASVQVLDFEDLKQIYIQKDKVISAVKLGSFSEVAVVLFDDVLNTNARYGIVSKIVKKQTGDTATRTYTVIVDGAEQSVVRKGTFSVSTGLPVMISYEGNAIDMLDPLTKVGSGKSIQAMEYDRIKVGGKVYTLSDELLIYHSPEKDVYKTLSRAELESANLSEIVLYEDFTGQVRAIRVTLK